MFQSSCLISYSLHEEACDQTGDLFLASEVRAGLRGEESDWSEHNEDTMKSFGTCLLSFLLWLPAPRRNWSKDHLTG